MSSAWSRHLPRMKNYQTRLHPIEGVNSSTPGEGLCRHHCYGPVPPGTGSSVWRAIQIFHLHRDQAEWTNAKDSLERESWTVEYIRDRAHQFQMMGRQKWVPRIWFAGDLPVLVHCGWEPTLSKWVIKAWTTLAGIRAVEHPDKETQDSVLSV